MPSFKRLRSDSPLFLSCFYRLITAVKYWSGLMPSPEADRCLHHESPVHFGNVIRQSRHRSSRSVCWSRLLLPSVGSTLLGRSRDCAITRTFPCCARTVPSSRSFTRSSLKFQYSNARCDGNFNLNACCIGLWRNQLHWPVTGNLKQIGGPTYSARNQPNGGLTAGILEGLCRSVVGVYDLNRCSQPRS